MNRTIAKTLAHLTAAVVVAILGPAPAATSEAAVAAAGEAAGPHCVVDLDSDRTACAATEQAAMRQLSTRARSYRVAKLWEHVHYKGRSLTYTRSERCTRTFGDHDRSVPVVPRGWNDRVSSIQTDLDGATQCSVRIYKDGRFRGDSKWIYRASRNLGTRWNDKASSWYIT